MDSFEISKPSAGDVVALRPIDAPRVRLCRESRLAPHQLKAQVAEHPELAYCSSAYDEYVVGGLWRQRQEIGAILETSCTASCDDLLTALLGAYRRNGSALVVVDPRDQERNEPVYRRAGFESVQTLVQMERHATEAASAARGASIRPMRERDIDAVLTLERNSFPWLWWNSRSELLWYAGIPGVELYVVHSDPPRRLAGYAGFTVFERQGHLDRLAVHRDLQRQGYGEALLAFSINRMASMGVRRMALTTQVDNLRSQALYCRFGFVRSNWSHELLGKWLRPRTAEETT